MKSYLYNWNANFIKLKKYSSLSELETAILRIFGAAIDRYFNMTIFPFQPYVDRLVQERRNSIANALELHLSYTKPSM